MRRAVPGDVRHRRLERAGAEAEALAALDREPGRSDLAGGVEVADIAVFIAWGQVGPALSS